MDPALAFWHVTGFFAPALLTGLLAAAGVKLAWRRELAGRSFWRLAASAAAAMAAASIAGLLMFQRDGMMLTYAAMVLAGSLALWWSGFRRR